MFELTKILYFLPVIYSVHQHHHHHLEFVAYAAVPSVQIGMSFRIGQIVSIGDCLTFRAIESYVVYHSFGVNDFVDLMVPCCCSVLMLLTLFVIDYEQYTPFGFELVDRVSMSSIGKSNALIRTEK